MTNDDKTNNEKLQYDIKKEQEFFQKLKAASGRTKNGTFSLQKS